MRQMKNEKQIKNKDRNRARNAPGLVVLDANLHSNVPSQLFTVVRRFRVNEPVAIVEFLQTIGPTKSEGADLSVKGRLGQCRPPEEEGEAGEETGTKLVSSLKHVEWSE